MIKTYNGRFVPKGDTEENWNKAVGFIPLDKEIIIYKADNAHSAARFKVGDGKTIVQELPFSGTDIVEIQKLIDEKCSKLIDENDDVLIEYVDNAITHLKEAIDEDATIFAVEVVGVYSYSFPDNVGITHIDWGDGTVGSELLHTYKDRGDYICRVYGANALTKNYPGMVLLEIGKSVTRIGERVTDGMFFSTRHLILPDTVTQIDDNAFSSSITSLIIGNGVTSIGKGAFSGLSLTSIVIPDSVQSIGDYTFKNCNNLTSVVIGDGITSINYEMFMNCKNLRSIAIPDNVTSIGERAFYNCQNLTRVVIGDKVTTISKNAFLGCSSLTSVKFGDSVTSIGDSAFEGCSNLTHIEMPSCVTTIETDAFRGCEDLTTIEIPRNVSFLGTNAFNGCSYLQSIIFKNPVPVTYTFEMIYGYSGRLTHIYVPYGCVEEYKTKWTADGAPERILNLIVESDREAMMSDLEVFTADQQDFIEELNNEVSILTLNIEEGDSKIAILGNLDKTLCTKIDWGDSTIDTSFDPILQEAYHNYKQEGEYICKIYGGATFTAPKVVTKYHLDKRINIIKAMFANCQKLYSIMIPDSVTEIGERAFADCDSLTSVVIPDSVTTIGSYAFENCDSLTSVVIGNSVGRIGLSVFSNCSKLTEIIFKRDIPVYYGVLYLDSTTLKRIYVPYGCAEVYKTEWAADGANQSILDLIIESDREAMISDVNALKYEIQEQLVGKTDYLGIVAAMTELSTVAGAGDYHRVSTEFVYDESTGEIAHVGDILIAVVDNPAQTVSDWDLLHTELRAAPATKDNILAIFN